MKKIINIIKFLFILLIFLSPSLLGQQEQIRIMAYNLLEYWNNGDNVFRDTYFRDIINATTPDIISAIEFNTSTDTKPIGFLNSVLNNSTANLYKMGTFIADIDYLTSEIHSDANVIYYKPSKFTFLSSKLIIADNQPSGTNHPSYEYQLYNNLTGNKIIIYGVHFTSGGSGGASLRNDNATTIRSYSDVLPSGSFFVIAGDFNFFNGGNEPAFTTLLSGTTGKFIDPLNLPSNDNWSSYHAVHTLSTRSSSFGGSVENYGLKFRSDLILNSQAIVDPGGVTYNSSSYITYGNDGNHYSSSINSGTNSAVSSTIADALYYASDHLPVYADYTFEIPNTINPPYPGGIVFTQVGVDDGNGNNFIEFMTLYRMNLQSLKITSNPVQSNGTISGGNYFDLSNTPSTWADVPGGTFVRLGENLINDNDAGDRILQYDGANSGTLPNLTSESNQLIAYTGSATTPTYYIAAIHWGDTQGWTTSSNAPFDTPSSSSIALTASASDNWFYNSSVSGNLYTTRNSLTAPGNWSTTGSGYHNLTGSISSGLLPVELSSFTGSITNKNIELNWRTETEVNNYGFEIEKSIDKTNWEKIGFVAGHGNSNTPIDYSFADNSNIPGSSVYYRLKQIDVDGKYEYSTIVELKNKLSSKPVLSQNYPNPFNPESKIDYTVPKAGYVSLRVYDVLGREVKVLVNKGQNAGKYSVTFNGEDLSSGIYFYVLSTNNVVLTKKMIILK